MKKNFETSLSDLEKIVRELEEGDLSLEESLKLFEEGIKLSRECRERLNEAERRIEVLIEGETGEPLLQEIEPQSLRDEPKPKIKKRIVFDDNDDTPF